MLTGFFTGAVLTLQSSATLQTFGAVGLTGSLVSISLVRELGPVLGGLWLSSDNTRHAEASAAIGSTSEMVESVADSQGTAGRLIHDPALY